MTLRPKKDIVEIFGYAPDDLTEARHRLWEIVPASEHGLNWANVRKRLIPQLIQKGLALSRSILVTRGLFLVIPEIVFRRIEGIVGSNIPRMESASADTLTIHTYGLSEAVTPGRRRGLQLQRSSRVSLLEFSRRFFEGDNVPSGEEVDSAVRSALGLENS